jgi:ketosteroid isomerase-like protein
VFVYRGKPTAPRQVDANDTATIQQSGARTQAVATTTPSNAAVPSAPLAAPSTTPSRTESGQSRESPILRAVQANANEARRRATDAGATTALLQAGDAHRSAAERAIRSGQLDEAAAHFSQASSAWSEAERSARASRTAAVTSSAPPATPPKELSKPTVAAPPTSSVVAAPQPSPVAAAPQTAPPQSNANATAEITAAVADYARAIEARDIAALRRVYPGMTPSQQSAFEDFFRSVRTLRAGFTTSNLQVDGNTAEARLSGTYDFVTGSGQTEHQPLTLQATLKRESSGWRFVSIH